MINKIKKASALIIAIVLMTESVSAASLNGISDAFKGAGSYLTQAAREMLWTNDEATSDMSISDDITSGQATIGDYTEKLLNGSIPYSELGNAEKRILNYDLGVRADTMELLQGKGYSLKASIPLALIMQRMNVGVSQAEAAINKLGEELALSQSLKFIDLEARYGDFSGNKFTAERIAGLMADGYNGEEAINLFVMSQSFNVSVDEIREYNNVKNTDKSVLPDEAAEGNNAVEEQLPEPLAENEEVYLDEELNTSSVVEDTQALEFMPNTAVDTKAVSQIANKYGINNEIVVRYAEDNDFTAENIEAMIANKAEELGLNDAAGETEETKPGDDENKLKGPFVAATGINDSINYNTGAVMYDEDILSLPGTNGFDFNLKLHYDSSKRLRYDDSGSEVFENDNNIWELGFTRLINEYGGDVNIKEYHPLSGIRLKDGSVYDLEGTNEGYYRLEQYAYDDIRLYRDTNNSFGEKSKYYVEYVNGTREYFDTKGRYIGSQDIFGNKITVTINENATTIVDSCGRNIEISYTENSQNKVMTVKAPDQSTTVLTFEKKYLGKIAYVWNLVSKTQTVGSTRLVTNYSYDTSRFYEKDERETKKYSEILLTSVTYPTGMKLNYTYDEEESGKTQTYEDIKDASKDSYKYARITDRYYTVEGKETNKTTYTYTDTNYTGYMPKDYKEDDYTYGVTVRDAGGLDKKYVFNEYGLNTSITASIINDRNYEETLYTKNMVYNKSEYSDDDRDIYKPDPELVSLKSGSKEQTKKYVYNKKGLLTEYYAPQDKGCGGKEYKTTYCYGDYGILLSKTYKKDANTNIIERNTVSENKCLITSSTVEVGGSVKAKTAYVKYDEQGNPLTVNAYTDTNKYITTQYSYNKGLLSSVKKGTTTLCYEYDSAGRLLKETDGNNGITAYTYDTLGNIISKTTPAGSNEAYTYNYIDNNIRYKDPNGNVLDYDYDAFGSLISVKSGSDTLEAYSYDDKLRCISKTVGNSKTSYAYDSLDRVKSVKITDNNDNVFSHKEYEYDGYGDVCDVATIIKNKNYNGVQCDIAESVKVDENGWVIEKYHGRAGVNSLSPYVKYDYDYIGNPIKAYVNVASTDVNTPESKYAATTYECDYAGRVTKETDSFGNSILNSYDMLGRKLSTTDKNGNTSTAEYDEFDRVIKSSAPMTDSADMKKEYTYDKNGNVITERTLRNAVGSAESWNSTSYTYDADNRVKKVTNIDTDSSQYYTEYEYDANGNQTRVITANGKNAAEYSYDKYNRVIKMTDPMGYTESYTYDIAGNMLSKTDRNGNKINYTYDPANRLTKEYCGSNVRAEYTYDLAGNKIVERNTDVTVKSLYGSDNMLTKTTVEKAGQNAV